VYSLPFCLTIKLIQIRSKQTRYFGPIATIYTRMRMLDYVHYGSDANLCPAAFFRMWYVHMLPYEGFRPESLLAQGTAANARDVASMADAIDGAGFEINYWY
jgi:hypothetical protein